METSDLEKYTDAIACLRQTLNEGRKISNVDIQLMLFNVQRCQTIVQQLLLTEQDPLYMTALSSLAENLASHVNILNKKIIRLQENQCTKDISPLHHGSQTPVCSQGINLSEQKLPSVSEDNIDSKQSKSRQNVIESTIVRKGQVRFSDVVGLTEAKCSLQDAIIMPLMFPHLFSGGRKPWKRILLYGPPGTGKSHLAQAVSTEVQATFYSVSSTDLMSSWVGESEKLIKELFHHASCQAGQSVIFIDEIDSLCRRRTSREDEGTRRIKTELLIQMDGVDRNNQDKIFLLCATNCPWELDTAFIRRFQKRIYIPLPDHTARIQLMKLHCQGNYVDLSESDWSQLATKTEGYSGSDLSVLTNGALFQPIRDLQTATHWEHTKDRKWLPCDPSSKTSVEVKMVDLPPQKITSTSVMAANPYDPVTTDCTNLTDDDWGLSLPPIQYKRYLGTSRFKYLCNSARQHPRCIAVIIALVVAIVFISIILAVVSNGGGTSRHPTGAEDKWKSTEEGLEFYPIPESKTIVISFNYEEFMEMKDPPLKKSLDKVMEAYLATNQLDDAFVDCNSTYHPYNRTCRVSQQSLGKYCGLAPTYGYKNTQPCILIQLNLPDGKTIQPISRNSPLWEEADVVMEEHTDPSSLPLTCEGKDQADRDVLKSLEGLGINQKRIDYFPKDGFPSYIYRPRNTSLPFVKPAVMVQLTHIPHEHLIHIKCTAWGQLYENETLINHRLLTVEFAVYSRK